jgi:hypothetical protein
MTRRLLSLLALTVAMGVGSLVQAADTPAKHRLFEMRTYYTHDGRLPALNKRFREHTNKLFVKHGMELVGYWMPTDKPETLVYILAYPDKKAREASWKGFGSDPEWKKAQAASEKDGKIVKKVESVFLNPTDYSPIK